LLLLRVVVVVVVVVVTLFVVVVVVVRCTLLSFAALRSLLGLRYVFVRVVVTRLLYCPLWLPGRRLRVYTLR